ncbi:hypothetical protein Tco_0744788 [Tanacetum coccineum]
MSIDYRVTLGFGSIAGGLDHVNLVIRLPIEHGISRGTRVDNIMDEINIDDLTIEQYLRLTQENQTPSMVKMVDDMTIAEYIEYDERMKRQYKFPRNAYLIQPNTKFNYDSKDMELDEEARYTTDEESVMSEHEAINPAYAVNTESFEEELSSEEDLDEWLKEEMEKHMMYPVGGRFVGLEVDSIRRIQGFGYGVLEFLGVGTTLDIFQNIHILYLEYGVLVFSGYGVLGLFPSWSLVSAGTDTLNTDNPNITMEEYIRLREEKALSRGETFNWQISTYDKMEYYEDEDDCFTNFETKFPAIVLDNTLTSDATISCGPTVSPLSDNEIDFRISFDKSDDEDYTVGYDENSFSYKIIYVNNLKIDSENDNKVNMPSFPSPKPEVNYSNDLDFFKDFENEFPAIVYNDALTSKLDFLTEPTISPQHIDEFDLKDETSLYECDEEEQNVLYFNDLFPFNVIYPDDLKSDTDNNNKIDIERPSGDMSVTSIPDESYGDLAETMIWYILKRTCVELIRTC